MNKKGRGVEVLIYGFEEQKSEGENSPPNGTNVPRVKKDTSSSHLVSLQWNFYRRATSLYAMRLSEKNFERRKRKKINRYQLHVDKRSRGMIEMYVQFDYTVNLYQMMELRGGFLECY